MAPKKPAESRKRKRLLLLLKVKQDIIRKHERGVRVGDLAREYGRTPSTISTILKFKEKIMARDTAKGVTIIAKNRPAIMDKMEKLLLLWIYEKKRAGDIVTTAGVCAKAKALHADLLAQQPGTSHEEFKASKGWFEKFKVRSGIHGGIRLGKAARSNLAGAADFACIDSSKSSTEGQTVVEEIVSLGQTIALEVLARDMEHLVKGHDLELTTDDLMSMQKQEDQGVQPDTAEELVIQPVPPSVYKRACELWKELQTFVNNLSRDQAAAQEIVEQFDNVIVAPWRAELHKRQRQQTMDGFLVKRPKLEEEPCCSSQLSPSASSSQK